MTCYQMKMLLPSFDNDELSEEERQLVERHLSSCAGCRSALDALRTLRSRLALLQTMPLHTEITDSIVSQLRWMTGTQAPEAAVDASDIRSRHFAGGRETREESFDGETPTEPQLDPDDYFLPGWCLESEP